MDNIMNREQKNNRYEKFEAGGLNAAACVAMAPVRGVHRVATPAAVRADKGQDTTNKWVVLALSASATFMTTLDGSIVNIGLPSIAHTFNVGISGTTEWIIIGYLVVIAAVLLTFGRLADMIGRKP